MQDLTLEQLQAQIEEAGHLQLQVHNPNNLPLIDYRTIIPLQDDLKELSQENYNKLLLSLARNGFFVPFFLWPNDGQYYALDGHQRHAVLSNEDAQPYELPYLIIEADTMVEAKQKLLNITSQYGTITHAGLEKFAADLNPDWVHKTVAFANLVFKPLNPLLERDRIALPTGPTEQNTGGGRPNASHNDYSMYELAMLHENKLRLLNVLNEIKEEQGLRNQEEALMHLVDSYPTSQI